MCLPTVHRVRIFPLPSENRTGRQHKGKMMSIPHSEGLIGKSTAGRE